jgi:O-acetyl-ADP-ribose deacetylase (regulator of RNase III)
MTKTFRGKLEIVRGNILEQDVDFLVNSAHPSLLAGGGVSGAIHRAAGPELEKAARPLGPLKPGQAAITPGFNLKAKFVIHAVAPRYHEFQQDPTFRRELLLQTYTYALELAVGQLAKDQRLGHASIAFPSMGTGIYGWPLEEAAEIAVDALWNGPRIDIYIVAFDETTAAAYEKAVLSYGS